MNTFLNMEIAENEENNATNPVSNPSTHYSSVHCVHNMYFVHNSAGKGF